MEQVAYVRHGLWWGKLEIFIEDLQESILQSVQNYWGKNPETDLQELARHVK